jgi:amphi-Trp domain-containing protein
MSQGKQSFRHESLLNAEGMQDILKAINKGIAKGSVIFSDEDDEMIMEPEGLMNLKLTATQEDGRNRINIRITWQGKEEKKAKKNLSVKSRSDK